MKRASSSSLNAVFGFVEALGYFRPGLTAGLRGPRLLVDEGPRGGNSHIPKLFLPLGGRVSAQAGTKECWRRPMSAYQHVPNHTDASWRRRKSKF
ncbi:hypothetical protein L228DRAFT_245036, partial [Xylona heveae TC161]